MEIVGYTGGTFDLFHVGHLRLLQRAKKQCDTLIVGVNTNEVVKEYKNHLPIIPCHDRIEIIQSLDCVNFVEQRNTRDIKTTFKQHSFSKIFIGSDWKDSTRWKIQVKELGNKYNFKVIFIPYTKHISSSKIIDRIEWMGINERSK